MMNRILAMLGAKAPARPLPEADGQHLLGALMVRVAQADTALKFEELRAIDRLFTMRFGLGPVEAARMRADCERLAAVLPETAALGPMITAAVPPEQRFALREALREVAEADGNLDPRETAVIDAVCGLLENAV